MTRKDFEAIANTIKGMNTLSAGLRITVAEEFARMCSGQNERFDHDRFMRACGVQ